MQRVTRPVVKWLESMPLTWRLVAILLTLLLAALTTTAGLTGYLLQRDLVQSVDDQLRAVAGPVARSQVSEDGLGDSSMPNSYAFAYDPAGDVPGLLSMPTGETDQPDLPALDLDSPVVSSGRPFTVSSVSGDLQWRFIAGHYSDGSATFAVGVPLREVKETVGRFAILASTIGLITLGASGVLGFFATRRAFRPLRRMEDTAAAIAAGDFTRRVPVRTSHDEVASLGQSLNSMLSRIEHSFAVQEASEGRMRQFVADASHELRTPLATVRGYAELYRQGAARDPEAVATSMGRIEGEAARMSGLVEDLLTLARLDDERPLDLTDVDLVVLCAEAAHDARARAPHRAISVHALQGDLEPVVVRGDDARLRQVLSNLVANALMHTAEDVPVEILVGHDGRDGQGAVLQVRDHGVGLDPESAQRVFERFYRVDKGRSRAQGGSGLGLAIVAAIVSQHGGTVTVQPTEGGGATFAVALPTSPPTELPTAHPQPARSPR